MKKDKWIFLLGLISLFIVGCTNQLDFSKLFDKSAPFTVAISDTVNKTTASYDAPTSSPIHNKFVQWLESNQDGWKKAPASYIGDIMVKQGDFTLIRLKNNGVMISFTGKAEKHLQYTKDCDKTEFEFLKQN